MTARVSTVTTGQAGVVMGPPVPGPVTENDNHGSDDNTNDDDDTRDDSNDDHDDITITGHCG